MDQSNTPTEESLDPQDWEAMRKLGHRMVDDIVDYMKNLREGPAWRHASDDVKQNFKQPLPLDPHAPDTIYEEFLENVLPYPIGNNHPRFWGWVFGTGTIFGTFADFLASSMNTNSGDLDHHSAIHVEMQVLDWLKEMLGYPASASGLLTGGCSTANLIALAVARNSKAGFDVRREGLARTSRKMLFYASQEIHSSIQKAVELLGLGSAALRNIPVNAAYQIDLHALKTAVDEDIRAGHLPVCVIGAAGTTNTGAIDDLDALADICQEKDLWFHIDAAFGAWCILAPAVSDLVHGMARADSLAFDLHKWMYMPFDIGCVLVRHEELHRKAFSLTPAYLARQTDGRGLTGGDLPWLTDYDFQLSRQFRALKAWMSIKEHGVRKYGRLIQQNIDQARYLAELITAAPELELAAPVPLNIVCFRYTGAGLDDPVLDAINRTIMVELQERGVAVISGTTINERFVLRVGHTNHRSRREDFDVLVAEVISIGNELTQAIHRKQVNTL